MSDAITEPSPAPHSPPAPRSPQRTTGAQVVARLLACRPGQSPQRSLLDEYLLTQFIAPARLRALQIPRLRRLLWHCLRNVPGYRRSLLQTWGGSAPIHLAGLEDPAALPLTTPAALKSTPALYRATSYQGGAPRDPAGLGHAQALEARAHRWTEVWWEMHPTALIAPAPLRDALFGLVAAPCPFGARHLCAERLLVEVLGSGGQPLPIGAPGQLVLTDLCNFAAPLLRVPLPLSGRLSERACPCGLGLVLLEDLIG